MVRTLIPWSTRSTDLFDVVCKEMDGLVNRYQGEDRAEVFTPRANIAETEHQFEITFDLPGLKAEDVNVELHDGQLSISGNRDQEETVEGKKFHRIERRYGEFKRIFSLGPELDADGVEANYQDGVLQIVVPKVEKARPKKIEVKS